MVVVKDLEIRVSPYVIHNSSWCSLFSVQMQCFQMLLHSGVQVEQIQKHKLREKNPTIFRYSKQAASNLGLSWLPRSACR